MANNHKGQDYITTDHDVIKQWTEERGGKPAVVKDTMGQGDVGLLRIDFPGYSGTESLEDITWDEFFREFDEKDLAFLFQDTMNDGSISRFSKFVKKDDVKEEEEVV